MAWEFLLRQCVPAFSRALPAFGFLSNRLQCTPINGGKRVASFHAMRPLGSLSEAVEVESLQRKSLSLPDDEPLMLKSTISPSVAISKENAASDHGGRLILIDGKAVIYRAYYKLMAKLHYGKLEDVNADGDWVLTVFTALSTILRILELNASHVAVVFDHEGGPYFYTPPKSCNHGCMYRGLTFRHTMFPGYKQNRAPTPDTVVQALQYLKPALLAMAVKTIEIPGVEADDVIGTLAVNAVDTGMKVRVVSPDKDFFQIISSSLRLLRFVPRGSGIVSFGLEEFNERFGNLQPSQFIDVLALVGDRVDNIPGVGGIGEKTAIQLVQKFGSLENLLDQREKVQIKKAREGLLADKGDVLFSKRLVTLRTDLPYYMVPYTVDDLVSMKPQDGGEKFMNLLKAMGSFVDESIATDLQIRTKKLWIGC